MGKVIALLGAECTGKTTLANALTSHWQATGRDAVVVPEYLRQWCQSHARTPLTHEQAHIAHAQQMHIDTAAAEHAWVFADTTALSTAVYSDYYFADHSLYPPALAAQRAYSATLLLLPDLPWHEDGLQRDSPSVREGVSTLLHKVLDTAQLPYQKVYGTESDRLLNTIGLLLK
jgi:nicotinamide riboside kinase